MVETGSRGLIAQLPKSGRTIHTPVMYRLANVPQQPTPDPSLTRHFLDRNGDSRLPPPAESRANFVFSNRACRAARGDRGIVAEDVQMMKRSARGCRNSR
jgi:hypothetical protein